MVGYPGQYATQVAITNQRIVAITDRAFRFRVRDFTDQGRSIIIELALG
jgi:hypothetical protein